jgi:hypothetical protein
LVYVNSSPKMTSTTTSARSIGALNDSTQFRGAPIPNPRSSTPIPPTSPRSGPRRQPTTARSPRRSGARHRGRTAAQRNRTHAGGMIQRPRLQPSPNALDRAAAGGRQRARRGMKKPNRIGRYEMEMKKHGKSGGLPSRPRQNRRPKHRRDRTAEGRILGYQRRIPYLARSGDEFRRGGRRIWGALRERRGDLAGLAWLPLRCAQSTGQTQRDTEGGGR